MTPVERSLLLSLIFRPARWCDIAQSNAAVPCGTRFSFNVDRLSALAFIVIIAETTGVRLFTLLTKFGSHSTLPRRAGHSIAQSVWARAYHQQQRQRGKDHHAVVRALAFKWIRIVFRCWQDRVAYDETIYLRTLATRGSHLTSAFAAAAASM